MKDKIMLIAGCSHAAGYEIDGTEDSKFNRNHSFGNILASNLGYRPINTCTGGAANPSIARGVIEWFNKEYDPGTDVFVLIGWTESSRMEIPFCRPSWYADANPAADWVSDSSVNFLRINGGWPGGNEDDRKVIPYYQEFMVKNLEYQEIVSANCVLQVQYFLKMHQVKYLMCNTMHMFSHNTYIDFYLKQIDNSFYMCPVDNDQAFYKRYRDAGYTNTKARYWHHDGVPHQLYAAELYSFIKGGYADLL